MVVCKTFNLQRRVEGVLSNPNFSKWELVPLNASDLNSAYHTNTLS
mgnify:CR=1 FL=1